MKHSRLLSGLIPVLLLTLLFATGCEKEPFCLECVETDGGQGDSDTHSTADGDSVPNPDGDVIDDSDIDEDVAPDAELECNPVYEELCNNFDDNCNGQVDEGFNLQTDPRNCGECNNICLIPHAYNICVTGECQIDVCDVCFHNNNDDDSDGCEYACCRTESPVVEGSCEGDDVDCCDGLDNNCDGEIDEDHDTSNDPQHCGECMRRCDYPFGVARCDDGVCALDHCVDGRHNVDGRDDNGCEYSCNPSESGIEECNSIDDDCDGDIDEDFPGMGDVCGVGTGACETGTLACIAGRPVCDGEVTPEQDLCDGIDNDCDGDEDDDDPRITTPTPCGSNVGECVRGEYACTDGELLCVGGVEASAEVCNGRDDDCDGEIDNGAPDDGTCGTDEGLCSVGTRVCDNGAYICDGATEPVEEECNGFDDDCDGETDEDFNLMTDPFNCGECGNSCFGVFENAVAQCNDGVCERVVCLDGFYDLDDDPDCEYPCVFSGLEECNGFDDDCNGEVDDWTPDDTFCGVHGVCLGVTVTCEDPDLGGPEPIQPVCDYPSNYQETETWCDGVDNDCDGQIDEGYDVGEAFPCDNDELGRCFMQGHYECDSTDPTHTSVVCILNDTPLTSTPETCNGIDDDCDGDIDEGITLANMNLVEVTSDVDLDGDGLATDDEEGRHFWMFQYEASHPDASGTSAGTIWSYACSNEAVLPWTALAWRDAQQACCGLNASGECATQSATTSDGTVTVPEGWSLCTSPDWTAACQVGSNTSEPDPLGRPYVYPYGSGVSEDYDPDTCNGIDADSDPFTAGNQTHVTETGAFSSCSGGSGVWSDDHYDMSGNLHEWTFTGWFVCACDTGPGCQPGCGCDTSCVSDCICDDDTTYQPGVSTCQYRCNCDHDCYTFYEYRGGSFENAYPGLTCQFDFNVGVDRSDDENGSGVPVDPVPGLMLDSLGFRCCYYPTL